MVSEHTNMTEVMDTSKTHSDRTAVKDTVKVQRQVDDENRAQLFARLSSAMAAKMCGDTSDPDPIEKRDKVKRGGQKKVTDVGDKDPWTMQRSQGGIL